MPRPRLPRPRLRPSPRPAPDVRARWWHGPLPAWPRPVDHLVESWWRLPARLRLVLGLLVVAVLAVGLLRESSSSPWGAPVPVLVAEADAQPGRPVTTRPADWPRDLVPPDALVTPPDGAVATRPVRAGQVLVRDDLARDLDDLLRDGEVAVPLAQDLPELPAGARVVVLGTSFDGTGRRLATGRLLARSAEWTWVAVSSSTAPAVAAALATGQVTLALAAPP